MANKLPSSASAQKDAEAASVSLSKRTVLRTEVLQDGDTITVMGTQNADAAFFDILKTENGSPYYAQRVIVTRNGHVLDDDRHTHMSVGMLISTIRADKVEGVAPYKGAVLEPRFPSVYELFRDLDLGSLTAFPSEADVTFTVHKKEVSVGEFLTEALRQKKAASNPSMDGLLLKEPKAVFGSDKTEDKYVNGLYTRKDMICEV